METFTKLKELAENPHYEAQKQRTLRGLTDNMIDMPIIDLINGLNRSPHCFTLQSCYGHFVHKDQKDDHNLDPLPEKAIIGKVKYRIACVVFCIENSASGRGLFEALRKITTIDPDYVQFCCAEWFWKRQVNSYALQVEPDRFKGKDTAMVDFKEALRIEKVRNIFFTRLYELLENVKGR